CMQPLQISLTF
nr:immunoglobulin light chain junction region [Macaca mulatta]